MGSRIKNAFVTALPYLAGLFLYFQISSADASLGHLHSYFPDLSSLLFNGNSSSVNGIMGAGISFAVLVFSLFLLPFLSSYKLEAAMLTLVGVGFYVATTVF